MSQSLEERYEATMINFMEHILPQIQVTGDIREEANGKFNNHAAPAEQRLKANRIGSQSLDVSCSV